MLCLASYVGSAHADDLADFEQARRVYESLRYEDAVAAFTKLIGGDPPQLRDALLVIESRKYLAASLVFVGAQERAAQQFRALLLAEPDYAIDPLAFPDKVVNLFDHVKRQLGNDLATRQSAEQRAKRVAEARQRAAEAAEKARLKALRDLATTEIVEIPHSRWLATIPFGIGQIQNGHRTLGRVLAVFEGVLLAGTIGTFIAHSSLRGGQPVPADLDDARASERALRLANHITFAAFLALAAGGILDAHLRFEPFHRETRTRKLSPELRRWVDVQLGLGTLRVRF